MEGSCSIEQSIVAEELIWNDPICQARIETESKFKLPDSQTIAKIETSSMLINKSLDTCCQAFADGNESMKDACTIMDQILLQELVWNDINCQMRTDTQIEY